MVLTAFIVAGALLLTTANASNSIRSLTSIEIDVELPWARATCPSRPSQIDCESWLQKPTQQSTCQCDTIFHGTIISILQSIGLQLEVEALGLLHVGISLGIQLQTIYRDYQDTEREKYTETMEQSIKTKYPALEAIISLSFGILSGDHYFLVLLAIVYFIHCPAE
ncbi:unnamed protein product [Albugo candida]|uniref:Uncharacterized protein n=1 Tax=Albugo candida TaxID=65357 RepID=A0A024GT80_9STRA|nr:unnamed protein product [Albugo candida]|eukprot:CCI50157.1 unnamed protein product [Albugo candida]